MTSAELRFWEALQRRTAELEPEVRRAIAKAFRFVQQELGSDAALTQFVKTGGVDRVTTQLLSDQNLDRAFAAADREVQRTVMRGAQAEAVHIPGARLHGLLSVGFDVLNPKVVTAIRQLDTRVMQTLKDGIRETVRTRIQLGLEAGEGPLSIARDLRDVIGMAPNQLAAVQNFERMLREGDTEALTRELRDHRFDATLRNALGPDGKGLTETQITKMTEAYRTRMIAWNAETNARTATIDALKLGQSLAWDNAVENGVVDGSRLWKTWIGRMDSRERPSHVAMEGDTVRYNDPYSNGQQIPGDDEYNCRCASLYRVMPVNFKPISRLPIVLS